MQTVGAPKELSLSQLEDWLWGIEVGYGPIVAIGHNDAQTAATFEFDLNNPTSRAVIRPLAAGQAIPPEGKAEVCRGEVFIVSQLQKVAVFR